jgi:hypothetical protein
VVAYTVSDNTTPLPVELTSFTTAVRKSTITLSWKTATETNNYGFEIERSAFGEAQWRKVAFVEGAGTTNAPKEYSLVDKNLSRGTYVYRLKQIDRDGKFEYSHSVEAIVTALPDVFGLSQNYPNPFNPSTTISFALPVYSTVTVIVYDMTGREVATVIDKDVAPGYYGVPFDGASLSSGVYFYRMTAIHGGLVFSEVKRFMLIK